MTCLIVHPQNNVRDFLVYSSIVRYICQTYDPSIEIHYIVLDKFSQYCEYLYGDGLNIHYVYLDDLTDNNLLRLLMGDHKNTKDRQFYGYFDKYRFDTFKGMFQSHAGSLSLENSDFNPYEMYKIEPSVHTRYFAFTRNMRVETNKWKNSLERFKFKFNAISSIRGFQIPKAYITETTLNVYLDSMFTETNFFESMVIIMNASKIYLRHNDVYTLFVYLLQESGTFSDEKSKTIHLLHKGEDQVPFKIPAKWKSSSV